LRPLPDKIYGVTVDSIANIDTTVDALGTLSQMPMTRIVFDEWQPATDYAMAVSKIYAKSFVLGEILDSSSVKQYTTAQYKARTREYLNALFDTVDVWEVGNEINGEWLGKTSVVVAKMSAAYDLVKARGGRTALTLYYNPNCWAKPSNEMFRWTTTNVPERMKSGLDYVLVSYYEEDCNGYQADWQQVISQLAQIFPNSKIGVGECGTRDAAKKEALIQQYYTLKVNHSAFMGGYFWWYFMEDMVPKTKTLWTVLNEAIKSASAP
ncbi:MAG: hypothetical protein ACKOA8_05580, partial [Deltaproteobacteria bacterium]